MFLDIDKLNEHTKEILSTNYPTIELTNHHRGDYFLTNINSFLDYKFKNEQVNSKLVVFTLTAQFDVEKLKANCNEVGGAFFDHFKSILIKEVSKSAIVKVDFSDDVIKLSVGTILIEQHELNKTHVDYMIEVISNIVGKSVGGASLLTHVGKNSQ